MTDVVSTESIETPQSNTLKSLEGRSYVDLPQEVRVEDKGLMTTLRLLSERTKTTGKEWSMYITKDRFGTLSPNNLRLGDEDEAQTIDIHDTTGLLKEDYEVGLRTILEGEKWREDKSDIGPVTIFGRDLEDIDKSKLHGGVVLAPYTEFFALVHTHRKKDVHSPKDALMLTEQPIRPDGRPEIPISIVVGPEDFYVLVVPKDGNVKRTGHYHIGSIGWELESMKIGMSIMHLPDEEKEKVIYDYVQKLCRDRKFGFYRGSLKDGVLKRVI